MRNIKAICSLLAVFILFLSNCKTTQPSQNIVNLKEAYGIRHYSTIYALPKTVIRVNLNVVRTSYKKGPYQKYANLYLGLSDVIEDDQERWKITGIEFETYAIADTSHMYLIETSDASNKIQLKLSDCGLLECVYPDKIALEDLALSEVEEYTSHSINQLKTFTNHKLVDNEEINFDEVPLPKSVLAKHSMGDQASELAAKIMTLREDRAAIIVGDGYTTAMPGGDALKTMIEKIDFIQEQYLSMFKGKVKKENFQYSFDYIPEEARKTTQSIVFRFSEMHGIVENNDMSGIPMIIEIDSYENMKGFEQFKKNQVYLKRAAKVKETGNGLFYRIPEIGTVKLLANDDILKQEKIKIAQFGSIHSLPAEYLNGNYVIELYPGLGSLKSIRKIGTTKIEKTK